MVADFIRDVRYALRQHVRRPGIPIVIVISLGLAMGVSTSAFALINAVWFLPWPVKSPEQIRLVSPPVSLDEWRQWREQLRSFSGLAAAREARARFDGDPVNVAYVSSNYFDVLQVPLPTGPGLPAEVAGDGSWNVAIISHHFWQTRFGGDANVVGRTLKVNNINPRLAGEDATIVGVADAAFEGTDSMRRTHMWFPLNAYRHLRPFGDNRNAITPAVTTFGRLAPGVGDAAAKAEIATVRSRQRSDRGHPPNPVILTGTARYAGGSLSLQTRLAWQSLIVGILFITLIACANVANLLLARGQARRGEIAMRLALGASRGRLIQQLLTETFVLTTIAAWIGVIIGLWLPTAALERLVANMPPGVLDVSALSLQFDRRIFVWAVSLSAIACGAFGLVPALQTTRISITSVLNDAQGSSRRPLNMALLSYQTIVSVMALVVAGLMVASEPVQQIQRLRRAVSDLTVVRLDDVRGLDAARRRDLMARAASRLSTTGGSTPVAGMAGQVQMGTSQTLEVTFNYLEVLRTMPIAGRLALPTDDASRVVVVNEAFADLLWSGEAAIGQVVPDDPRVWDRGLRGRQIVGIVANDHVSAPLAYVPIDVRDSDTLFVRAPRSVVVREIDALLREESEGVSFAVQTGSEWVAPLTGPTWVTAWLTMCFGGLALALGALGFFSVLQYTVQQRTREIGIRRALGAQPRHIIASLLALSAWPLVRGLFAGSLGAAVLGIYMRRVDLPAGVDPFNVTIYFQVAVVFVIAAVVAAYGPARRAIAIEPGTALRID